MTIWICATCGIEHPDTVEPPAICAICSDDRQWVPTTGQSWTTHAELALTHTYEVSEAEPGLYAIDVTPRVGIGQRTFVVTSEHGNVLWEPPALFTEALVADVAALGPVRAVTSSHPHLVGSAVSLAEHLGVPYYVCAADERWIRRPSDRIELWSRECELVPGMELVQAGGHFPGSAVLHWAAGAEGRGVLLVGDTVAVNPDRASVSWMRSYPNYIPLSERLVRQIVSRLEPLAYDRLYGAFGPVIARDARTVVHRSAERYIGWITDAIRDPDEIDLS